MSKDLTYFETLATKYLSGNASVTEQSELEVWVESAGSNKAQFENWKKAWILSALSQENDSIDLNENWKKIQAEISHPAKVIALPKAKNKWIGMAAALAVFALLSFLLAHFLTQPDPFFYVEAQTEKQEVDLPDGSMIYLNQASSLSFEYEQNQRLVNLKGDAFFDVKRDPSQAFVIKTDELEVEVLGTSFYVDARKTEKELHVVVESGLVAVKSYNKEYKLKAGEKAVFTRKNSELKKMENYDLNFNALKSETLIFENASLEKVVFDLNRHYNSQIQLADPALTNCNFSSTFRGKSLDTILKILESSFNIQSNKKGDKIIFSGACD